MDGANLQPEFVVLEDHAGFYTIYVKPQWVIAVGEWEPGTNGIRIFLHGGSELVIGDTVGNKQKLGVPPRAED